MTERIKLENPGDELTLTIASVSHEEIGGYAYWKIADGQREFVIPQKSLDAQIDRAGVATAPEMVGKTIKFSRSIKLSQHKKPYWNLDLVGNGTVPPTTTPPKSAPARQPISHSNVPDSALPPLLRNAQQEDDAELQAKIGFDRRTIETTLSLYQSITEWYLDTIVPVLTKADVGCSPESVTAGIATIFIQAKRTQ